MEKNNGTHYINCYNQKTHERELYEIPYDVSVYIKQLEMKIKHPEQSKLFRLYPELEKKNENKPLITIERDNKYGGFDFGINGSIVEMSSYEYDELKSMIITAIGTMEDMRRRELERHLPAASMEKNDD